MGKSQRIKEERENGTRRVGSAWDHIPVTPYYRATKAKNSDLERKMEDKELRFDSMRKPHGANNRSSKKGRPHYFQKLVVFFGKNGKTLKHKDKDKAAFSKTMVIKHAQPV